MANIRKMVGVDGRISYKITVSHGRDAQYKQIRHFKTFTPPPGWSEKRVWRQWSLVADGEWHTLKYKGKNFDTAAWENMGIITKLRLDLTNNAPGKIEIREIRFTKSAN